MGRNGNAIRLREELSGLYICLLCRHPGEEWEKSTFVCKRHHWLNNNISKQTEKLCQCRRKSEKSSFVYKRHHWLSKQTEKLSQCRRKSLNTRWTYFGYCLYVVYCHRGHWCLTLGTSRKRDVVCIPGDSNCITTDWVTLEQNVSWRLYRIIASNNKSMNSQMETVF